MAVIFASCWSWTLLWLFVAFIVLVPATCFSFFSGSRIHKHTHTRTKWTHFRVHCWLQWILFQFFYSRFSRTPLLLTHQTYRCTHTIREFFFFMWWETQAFSCVRHISQVHSVFSLRFSLFSSILFSQI